ncbi:MAG: hypothetical protein JXB33_06895 [Clostridia bacterium]|nr:hypothetical protein [Clostridia bacterium]
MNEGKKKHGCLIAIIVFLVLVLLITAAVIAMFFLNRSNMPGLDEFRSEADSSRKTTSERSIADIIKIQIEGGGVSSLSIVLNNADLSALVNENVSKNDDIPLTDILFKCNEDKTVDMTAVFENLDEYAKTPGFPAIAKNMIGFLEGKRVYATVFIEYEGNHAFDITIREIKIGNLSLPFAEQLLLPLADTISDTLGRQLEETDNFELTGFLVQENQITITGLITN